MRPGLNELRKAHDLADPYGVPTGYVPRVPRKPRYTCPFCCWAGSDDHSEWMAHHCEQRGAELARMQAEQRENLEMFERQLLTDPPRPPNGLRAVWREGINPYARFADPIAKAVDDYLLMERKARAWDELYETSGGELLDRMDELVHPAQPSAPAER